MTRHNQKHQRGTHLSRNKRYYGLISLFVTGLLVISSTFAWVSWYEWKRNHLQGEPKVLTPEVAVQGSTGPQVLTHQAPLTRNLTVKNTGAIPVFVRVTLTEELVTFEVDTADQTPTGNGHLKEYPSLPVGATELQADVLSTWQVGHYFRLPNRTTYGKSVARQHYPYRQLEGGRPAALLPIQLNFGDVDPAVVGTTGYWLYQETGNVGYYYYSEILPVGEETTPLVTSEELTAGAPNGLKGGLHQLEVVATGGEAMSGIYAEWGIPQTPGNKLYDRYHYLLTQ